MKNIQRATALALVCTASFVGAQPLLATSTSPASAAVAAVVAGDDTTMDAETLKALRQTIRQVVRLPDSGAMQSRARRHGLNVLNVLWEDTGRYQGSSVGPNISDVTLQVREPVDGRGTRFRNRLLPVLRHPNFSDKTADIAADKLWVKVGNQSAGAQIVSVPLSELLKNLREYVSNPDSIRGSGDLSAPRDSHMLVSAQHVFVPIPRQGKIEFTPVIFNYQSSARNPAVLTLLVTRQGTSVVAIDNSGRDATRDGSGQQLFFNNKGQKATLTAERKSDVTERIEAGQATEQDAGALDDGADMMLIVQVPLKVRQPSYGSGSGVGYGSFGLGGLGGLGAMGTGAGGGGVAGPPMKPAPPSKSTSDSDLSGAGMGDAGGGAGRGRSDVEQAILGHGDDLGDFSEGRDLKLVRDPRFPVRVTVQFYKATSNGVISDADLVAAKREIDKVYARGDFVGSLVVPEGQRHRPTDWHIGHTRAVPIMSRTTTLPTPLNGPGDGSLPARAVDERVDTTVQTSTMLQRLKAFLFG